jgi:DNA-binding NtrC family response regulator
LPLSGGGVMHAKASVLIVDDDPVHLRIYGWIIEAAGYHALPTLIRFTGIEIPDAPVHAVVLVYRPGMRCHALEIAKLIQSRAANVPILVLSDVMDLPDDVAPLVQGFIRKGDPAKLVGQLHSFLQPAA